MNLPGVAAGAVLALAMTGVSWQLSAQQQMQRLTAMDPKAHPSFDVASIKKADPNDGSSGFQTQGRRVFVENETMNNMIAFAYGVHAKQIVRGPTWFGSERFDIRGLPDVDGIPNVIQQQEMIRKLLTERFKLQFHHEQREMGMYALTVAKGGPKVDPSKMPPDGLRDQSGGRNNGRVSWRITNNSMEEFAQFLQFELDRPVVDQTGLKGKYDFKLTWTANPEASNDPSAAPGFFTALQEQAGLKIEPSKGQVDVLAIDHVELPSAD